MISNPYWNGMFSLGRLAVLAASVGMGIAACASGTDPNEDVGTAELAVVNVPTDVHCFSVVATGASRTVTRSIDVMPGQSVSTVLSGLPTGQVTFVGSGFSTACRLVTATSVPTWISDPVTEKVQTSPIVNVPLVLHPNGRGTITADFQGDPACFPAAAACLADGDCCAGLLCLAGTCSTPVAPVCSQPLAPCGSNQDCCDPTSTCGSGVCLSPNMCVTAADCPAGMGCLTNKCMPAAGLPCMTNADCGAGLACSAAQRICLPAGNVGQVCVAATDCLPGLLCQGGICTPPVGGLCTTAAQCPGIDTDCRVRTCLAGICGQSNTPAGALTASQQPGDCRITVCDGAGNVTSIADATDLPPDDGNQCTVEVCLAGGMPTHADTPAGTACNQSGGTICNGLGACIPLGCATDAQCGPGLVCLANTCVPVGPGQCVPACPTGFVCQSGACVPPPPPGTCSTCSQLLGTAQTAGLTILNAPPPPGFCSTSAQLSAQDAFTCLCAGPCAGACGPALCAPPQPGAPPLPPACAQCAQTLQTVCAPQLAACQAN